MQQLFRIYGSTIDSIWESVVSPFVYFHHDCVSASGRHCHDTNAAALFDDSLTLAQEGGDFLLPEYLECEAHEQGIKAIVWIRKC